MGLISTRQLDIPFIADMEGYYEMRGRGRDEHRVVGSVRVLAAIIQRKTVLWNVLVSQFHIKERAAIKKSSVRSYKLISNKKLYRFFESTKGLVA